MFVCKLCSLHPSSLSTCHRSSSSLSVDKVSSWQNGRQRSVPATKRLATKCPRYEMAGDELYPWRNCWWQSVPVTKWQATKRWRRNCNKMGCTQRGGSHYSAVGGVLEFSHPCLVSVLCNSPIPNLKWRFYQKLFPPQHCPFVWLESSESSSVTLNTHVL